MEKSAKEDGIRRVFARYLDRFDLCIHASYEGMASTPAGATTIIPVLMPKWTSR
jgi:hypothetical protein